MLKLKYIPKNNSDTVNLSVNPTETKKNVIGIFSDENEVNDNVSKDFEQVKCLQKLENHLQKELDIDSINSIEISNSTSMELSTTSTDIFLPRNDSVSSCDSTNQVLTSKSCNFMEVQDDRNAKVKNCDIQKRSITQSTPRRNKSTKSHSDYENAAIHREILFLHDLKRYKSIYSHFNDCYLHQIMQTVTNFEFLTSDLSQEVASYQDRIAFLSQRIQTLYDTVDNIDITSLLCIPELDQISQELTSLAPVAEALKTSLFLPSSRGAHIDANYQKAVIDVEEEESKLAVRKEEIARGIVPNPYELLRLSSRDSDGVIQKCDDDYEAVRFDQRLVRSISSGNNSFSTMDPIKARCLRLLDRTLSFRKTKPTSADLLRDKYAKAVIDSPCVKPKSSKHRLFSRSKSHIDGASEVISEDGDTLRLRTVSRSSPVVNVPIDTRGFDAASLTGSSGSNSMRRFRRSKPVIDDPNYDRLSDVVAVQEQRRVPRRQNTSDKKEQRLERCSSVPPPKETLRVRAKAFFTRRRSFSSNEDDIHRVTQTNGKTNDVAIDPNVVRNYARRHHSEDGLLDAPEAAPTTLQERVQSENSNGHGTLRKISRSLFSFRRSRDKSIASQDSLNSKDSADVLAGHFDSRSSSPESIVRTPNLPLHNNNNFTYPEFSPTQQCIQQQSQQHPLSVREQNMAKLNMLVKQRKKQRAIAAECVSNCPAIPLEKVKVWLKSGSKKRRHSADAGPYTPSATPTNSLQRRYSKQTSMPTRTTGSLGVSAALSRSTSEQLNQLSRQFSQAVTLRRSYQSRDKLQQAANNASKGKELPQRISSGNWSGSSGSSNGRNVQPSSSDVLRVKQLSTSKDSAVGLRCDDETDCRYSTRTGCKMSASATSEDMFSEEDQPRTLGRQPPPPPKRSTSLRSPSPQQQSMMLEEPVYAQVHKLKQIDEETPSSPTAPPVPRLDPRILNRQKFKELTDRCKSRNITQSNSSPNISAMRVLSSPTPSDPYNQWQISLPYTTNGNSSHQVVKPQCRNPIQEVIEYRRQSAGDAINGSCPFGGGTTTSTPKESSPISSPARKLLHVHESPAIYQKLYSLTPTCTLADEEDLDDDEQEKKDSFQEEDEVLTGRSSLLHEDSVNSVLEDMRTTCQLSTTA